MEAHVMTIKIHPHAKHVQEIRALSTFASVDIDAHAIYAGRSEKPRTKLRPMAIVKRSTGKSARVEDVRKEMRGIIASCDTSAPKAKGHANVEK